MSAPSGSPDRKDGLPRLAALLIAAVAPREGRGEILGDLHERFLERQQAAGRARAHVWFWAQALSAVLRFTAARIFGIGAAQWSRRPVRRNRRNLELLRRDHRAPQGNLVGSMSQDLKYAVRALTRAPVVTVGAVLILAVGIGATSTIFSVVNAVVLRPLPYPEPERLIHVYRTDRAGEPHSMSAPDFLDFRAQNRSLEDLGAISLDHRQVTLRGDGEPTRLSCVAGTGSLLMILGVDPVIGRNFTAEEQRLGGDNRVVLLSHELWRQRFGGDHGIIGTTLDLDGAAWTVVGVLSPGFEFALAADVWIPFVPDPEYPRGDLRLEVFGRLRPGVTLEQAREDLGQVAARLAREYPTINAGMGVALRAFPEWLIGPEARQAALVLMFAVGLLLLLACANVSNILLARATARRQEIGLRTALGAGRSRIVRQLLTESLVLASPGAMGGLALAWWAVAAIRALSAAALPRIDEVSVDGTVLAFTVLSTLATGVIFGLAPALHAVRGNLYEAVRAGCRDRVVLARGFRNGLVVGQLALATMLLVGASVLATSFVRLRHVDPGFDPKDVLTVELGLPEDEYPELSPQVGAFYREVLERIEAIPGVSSAGATMINPFLGFDPSNEVATPDEQDQREFVPVKWRSVTHGFFRTLGVELVRGRVFEPPETGDRVAVISTNLAERLWPGADPVGRHLRFSTPTGNLYRVVGVVRPIRDRELQAQPPPTVYLAHQQVPWPSMTLLIKTSAEPADTAAAVRRAVWVVDKNVPVPQIGALAENIANEIAGPRFNVGWMGSFAVAALLMASMGIYGILSYLVAQRAHEIGIRVALGARPASMMTMVMRGSARLVAIGLALGGLGALSLSHFLESLLYETEPTHVGVFAIVATVLAVVAMSASWVPARRAARVDPLVALRAE